MESDMKIRWMPADPPARLSAPFYIETKSLFGRSYLHEGVIVIKCGYSAGGPRVTSGWGCLRVDNVPLMQLEELAQNFLVLAEARYGQ